jgi:hypothetical protein
MGAGEGIAPRRSSTERGVVPSCLWQFAARERSDRGYAACLNDGMAVQGIAGHPYIDLERYVDTRALEALDDEIAYALTQVPLEYTGGSHKTMGIVPPSLVDEPYIDYGHVIRRFTKAEFQIFVSLSDTPDEFDIERYQEYEFGEEREWPLSRKQMLYLKFKYGVYFPWQVFYEMIPTLNWEDKANGFGKDFTPEAKRHFPRLIEFVKGLPFEVIGRCNLLGLEANHHGTVHQDGDPEEPNADQFITLCPKRNKRLFLWDEAAKKKTFVLSRAYWFNDHGYHGVEPAPYFRYSVRVDGVFRQDFLERLCGDWGLPARFGS